MINIHFFFFCINLIKLTAAYYPVLHSQPSQTPFSQESTTTPSTAPSLVNDFWFPTVHVKRKTLDSPSFIIDAYQLFPETEYPTVGQPKQPVSQTIEGIELTLINVGPLVDTNAWESVTREWFTNFYQKEIAAGRLPMENFVTTVTVTNQSTTIRTDGTPVTVLVYTQTLQYSAPERAQSPLYYAQYPFTVAPANVAYGVVLSIGIPSWASVERPISVPQIPGLYEETKTPSPTTLTPTAAPTTALPTFSPTQAPTPIPPTALPTIFPTQSPTVIPTLFPTTRSPTLVPTVFPTTLPTAIPTMLQTISPVTQIPKIPTGVPTPVVSPSITTTAPVRTPSKPENLTNVSNEIIEATVRGIVLTLKKAGNSTNLTQWEQITAEWFEEFYNQPNKTNGTRLLQPGTELFVSNMSTTITVMNSSVTSLSSQLTNTIVYDQVLRYATRPGALTPEYYALLPFQDSSANERYGELLQRSFKNWQDLIIPVDIPVIPKQEEGDPSGISNPDDNGLSQAAFIGIVVSAAVVCIVCTCCIYSRYVDEDDENDFKRKKGTNLEIGQGLAQSADKGGLEETDPKPESASTLFQKKTNPYEPDHLDNNSIEPSSFISEEIENQQAFPAKRNLGSRFSSLEKGKSNFATRKLNRFDADESRSLAESEAMKSTGHSEFEDSDDEVEEILAPPGKLGVVIDTPDKGYPIVHEVKYSSPIATKISVGDTLLSIDGIDVRGMTALKVSKMIAKRAHQPIRKLVIIRCGKADEDEDDD